MEIKATVEVIEAFMGKKGPIAKVMVGQGRTTEIFMVKTTSLLPLGKQEMKFVVALPPWVNEGK